MSHRISVAGRCLFVMAAATSLSCVYGAGNNQDSCCPEGHTMQATHTVLSVKGGSQVLGEMTTATISDINSQDVTGKTKYFSWGRDVVWNYWLGGANDVDVCVNDDDPKDYSTRGVGTIVTWDGLPGHQDSNDDRHYVGHDVPKPQEGAVDTYSLTGTGTNDGPCNAGDESRQAATALKIYFQWKKGPAPYGTIHGKPPGVFFNTPTFRRDNQLLCKVAGPEVRFEAEVHDMDLIESNLYSAGTAPQVLWDDGLDDDPPGSSDVTWSASPSGGAIGNPVWLPVPVGGIQRVTWTVRLASIDDNCSPEKADDPPTLNADSVEYEVFRDHFARDVANLGPLIEEECNPSDCYGAAQHAYSGMTNEDRRPEPPWLACGATPRILFAADPDPHIAPDIDELTTFTAARGGIVRYNGDSHFQTCYGNGSGGVWEFNGRCVNEHQWGNSSILFVRDLLIDRNHPNACYPDPDKPGVTRFVTTIKYFPPPADY